MKRTGGISKLLITVGACVIGVGIFAGTVWVGCQSSESASESLDGGSAGPVAYSTSASGSAEKCEVLKGTVVVPTLDTPIPKGKNAIWCGSFQVAWNRLKDDVVHGPIKLSKEEALVDALNRDPFSQSDLPEGSYYAAAGIVPS